MMIPSSSIYLGLFGALFFMPGFFITVILGIKKFRFLLSVAFSVALLALTLMVFEYYARPIAMWQWCVLAEWVALAAWAIVKTLTGTKTGPWLGRPACPARSGDPACQKWREPATPTGQRESRPAAGPGLIRRIFNCRRLVPLALAGTICGYLAYAGIYLEIPADPWNHLSRFQWHKLCVIDNGVFQYGSSFHSLVFAQGSGSIWYLIHAWLCGVAGLSIADSLRALTFVNVLIFLMAIYYFGLFLFAGLRVSAFRKMMMAAMAALFAAATMGNMVFAYIRYYAFGPTILCYVLFLAAMAVIATWLRSDSWFGGDRHEWVGHAFWIAPVLLIAASAIHTQEALFIFFMTLALSLVASAKILRRKLAYFRNRSTPPPCPNDCSGPVPRGNRRTAREYKNAGMAAGLLLVFLAGFFAIRHFKPGPWLAAALPPAGIPPEPVNFVLNALPVSFPQNLWLRLAVCQLVFFYQTVGCWGLFVYLLFILMLRRFGKQPYLIAGMLVPFLTAFNPLLIDMMARMQQAQSLYRFHYMIPLPFVGGYLAVYFAGRAREWFHRLRRAPPTGDFAIWPRWPWINCAGCLLVLAGLAGLVFPIYAAGIYAPFSKIYTLRKMPAGNDYHLCDDLGKIVEKYENMVIVTDDWTCRYLWYYSPKNNYAALKWLSSFNPENEPPEPYAWEQLRKRGLVVINRRDGALSITGKIARHWPENIIPKVSRKYSMEAQRYLESHPEMFEKIWYKDRIAVYAVR